MSHRIQAKSSAATTPPLGKPVFITQPVYGIGEDSPLNVDEEYYSDEDEYDLQEALDQLEYDSGEWFSASITLHTLI
jgi:hypothetical protein